MTVRVLERGAQRFAHLPWSAVGWPVILKTEARRNSMSDIVRVYVRTGVHHDYPGADFFASRDGLTVTRPYADGRSGEETVAVFAPGKYSHAEKLPAETPPPDDTPLVG
jgi:hypothetical protein